MNTDKLLGPSLFLTSLLIVTRFRYFSALSFKMSTVSNANSVKLVKAKKIPHEIKFGYIGDEEDRGENPMNPPRVRVDQYHWLRDETRKNQDVLDYLNSENKYCKESMSHLTTLQKKLYDDMLSHLKETDEDVPYKHGNYEYYSRTVQGLAYKIHCRKQSKSETEKIPTNINQEEEVILDENEVAKGFEYTVVTDIEISPSHQYLAYSIDHSGYETYNIYIKDLKTGNLLSDSIENSDGSVVYAYDDSILFYMTMDEEHRPDKVFLHIVGTSQDEDICLLEEDDSLYWLGIDKVASEKYFVIDIGSPETSESYVLDLSQLKDIMTKYQAKTFKTKEEWIQAVKDCLVCVSPREFGVRYEVEHLMEQGNTKESESVNDSLLIVTNKDKAKNNKLMKVPVNLLGGMSTYILTVL